LYFECATKLRFALAKDETLTEANFLLGSLFEDGLSVDLSPENAYKYYKKAADASYAKAYTKLGHFSYSGIYLSETPNK
jgi:TPR repeat protein